MRKKTRFLAASITETIRYFIVIFLASALGFPAAGIAGNALFRYACLPQLLFAAGFFFLWLDQPRYARFRSLLLAGKAALVIPGAFLALSLFVAARTGRGGFMIPRSALFAGFAVVLLDLFSTACLLVSGNVAETSETETDTSTKESQ